MNNISATFRIKTSKQDIKKDGSTSIYFYLNINGVVKMIRTGKYVDPNHFDNSKGIVKKGNQDSIRMNELLNDFKKLYTQATLKMELLQKEVTHETLEAFMCGKEEGKNIDDRDFIKFAEEEIKLIDRSVSDLHYKNVEIHLSNLMNYQSIIAFKEIDYEFLLRYKNYMLQKGNKINTTAGSFRSIRLLVNTARRKGKTTVRPFDTFKIEKQETEIEFLTKDELIRLHELYDSNTLIDRLKNTLHYFLLSCYTGLRKGDISRLTREHIVEDTLVIMPNKTRRKGKIIRIPLSDRAKRLLSSEIDTIFKRGLKKSSSRLTNEIKEMLTKLKIQKHITFHGSRHTFAVNGLVIGIPLKVISDLLGHSSVAVTEIYAKVVDELKTMEMKKWNF
jgi:integrase